MIRNTYSLLLESLLPVATAKGRQRLLLLVLGKAAARLTARSAVDRTSTIASSSSAVATLSIYFAAKATKYSLSERRLRFSLLLLPNLREGHVVRSTVGIRAVFLVKIRPTLN